MLAFPLFFRINIRVSKGIKIVTVFSKAWQLLEDRIEAKTSWGKQELKSEMFLSLRDAALENEKKEDLYSDLNALLQKCTDCSMTGVDLLVYHCKNSDDRFHTIV